MRGNFNVPVKGCINALIINLALCLVIGYAESSSNAIAEQMLALTLS